MDESFMSIGGFDEENFLSEAFSEPNGSQNALNSSNDMSTSSIDIKSLLSEPFKDPAPKTRLVFADTETPKSNSRGHRKRKNTTRRCLSNDLNDSSLSFEDDLQTFDTSRHSKEPRNDAQFSATKSLIAFKKPNILSSIENTLSPKRNERKFDISKIELTPEFNSQNGSKNDENKVVSLIPSRTSKGGSLFQKSYSENHASIMQALQTSSSNPSLIGDFSKPYVLPFLSSCKHQDLKSISSHVLANLIKGQYKHCVESFTVIDCRYPYEFEGGHIQNAINLYTQELILSKLLSNNSVIAKTSDSNSQSKRSILIFHCEFSSERGPGLCRFLRNRDRVQNNQTYPCLNYPEMYLLEGGYKEFYTHYSTLCQPIAYLPMHSKEHENELRKFRSIVKSHSFDTKFTTHKRNIRH